MASDPEVQALKDASQHERDWRWIEAAALYEKAVKSRSVEDASGAELWKRIGFCYHLASRQSENSLEFEKLESKAVEAYENAVRLLEKGKGPKDEGETARCSALAGFSRAWLDIDAAKRKAILDECISFLKKAMELLKKAGEESGYAGASSELLRCLFERFHIASEWEEMRSIALEGLKYADEAISAFSAGGEKCERVQAYSLASLLNWYGHGVMPERKELMQRSLALSERAVKLSREVQDPHCTAMANWAASFCKLLFTQEAELALEHAKEMLKQGTVVKDNYFKGIACYIHTFANNWIATKEEDPDKKKRIFNEILEFAKSAVDYLEPIHQHFFLAGTYQFHTETLSSLARDYATSIDEKRDLLKRAIEVGRRGLKQASSSGSPDAMGSVLHVLSKALHFHSNLEAGKEAKSRLLREALEYRSKYIDIVEKAFPSNDWIRGVGKSYEGLISADLARTETGNGKLFLEKAVSSLEEGVSSCRKWILPRPVPTLVAVVGRFEDGLGEILKELYMVTNDKGLLGKANEYIREAAYKFDKVGLSSRVAESYWKMARNFDLLNDCEQGAQLFEKASEEYEVTAEKLPHFSDFYFDYAAYMKAWSEIERAKAAHNSKGYADAKVHYENVARMMKQSQLWGYLSPNFQAWALLEQAEDLSRSDENQKSLESFRKCADLFHESKETLQAKQGKIESADENELVDKMIQASGLRQKYCFGRITLEEARVLDQEGDHSRSSERYGEAAEAFQKIVESEPEPTQVELKPLVSLCRAWQKMMMAEARASPEIYKEAAELFMEAKNYTPDQTTSFLSLGNSSFCQALAAGTEFETARDTKNYQEARKHMETAANYYLRAGFPAASTYAKATQRLFDAYVYLDNAKREMEPDREARYYAMAERVLQIAAQSFGEAKHPEKKQQAQLLLQKVREEKELAVSLGEVLHAPAITSSTSSFLTLTPREEVPAGLERFERADVQAKLIQTAEDARVGGAVSLEIQIMNVGKEALVLSKIEETVPQGFELTSKPEYCKLEGRSLDMKGKRLEPLGTEQVKLGLKPLAHGAFKIAPTILCVDEHGRQVVHKPRQVTLEVRESTLPGRVTTGYADLDGLLFGGLPEGFAVILTSPSCDEKDLLVRRFLETGARKGETTFYVAMEASEATDLVEKFQGSFYLFICNPRADVMVKNLPNVFKFKGVENLTQLEITMISAFRKLSDATGPRRACIEILSDVLLQHKAIATRRWLAGLIPEFKSRGFTTLAVMNPLMHPPEEVQAVLGLFEGEINVYEKETSRGLEKFIRVRKMASQEYLRNELPLKIGRTHT